MVKKPNSKCIQAGEKVSPVFYKLKKQKTMKSTMKFTGFKVPKTLNLKKIQVKVSNMIPKNLDKTNFYYFFINEETKKWAIPQKCEDITPLEKSTLDKIHNYIINHYGYDRSKLNAIAELLPLTKERIVSECIFKNARLIEREKMKKERENKQYEKLQEKLGSKFEVKHIS